MFASAVMFCAVFVALAIFYARIFRLSKKGALPVRATGGPVNPDTTASPEAWVEATTATARYPAVSAAIALAAAVGEIALSFVSVVYPLFLVPALAAFAMLFVAVKHNLAASAVARGVLGLPARHNRMWVDDNSHHHPATYSADDDETQH
ncbi:hypothetical protein ACFSSC_06380 [Corynebacterium mendelii]|uniref:Uncharacterized protein n=1 Tax=Corynebacterium mendelii TaxID=2765362 RepID=A0A939E0C3_9CORY|nr:hypothetical protein [Corynebacterium mendelii]MBN9644605.1 hypothetical protein [Corynebacterium mendelii]